MESRSAPAAASPAAVAVSNAAKPLLLAMLRSQAYRELAAIKLLAEAQALATTSQSLQQLKHQEEEELAHLDAALELWSQLAGEAKPKLKEQAQARLNQHPLPPINEPLDVAMAQFVFDRAGYFQLRAYVGGSFAAYALAAEQIVKEEAQHHTQGAEALLRLIAGTPADLVQSCFDAWFTVSLRSFGRPGSTGDAQAVALGLKTQPAGVIMQDFIDDLRPTLSRAGLRLPNHEQLASALVHVPASVHL